MAQSNPSANKLTLFGYLQLQKKNLFKNAYRRYWFWFDEQTCCLKYYRSQETYTQGVNEPLGRIDLRYAKVTPGIISSGITNSFNITVNGQTYVMVASGNNEALSWISSLQEKRGDYIKVSAALEETAQEQERGKRTLMANKPVGALATGQDASQNSPTSVRKIVRSHLNRGSMALELVPPMVDASRRRTASQQDEVDSPEPDYELTGTPLTPEDRKILELESACLNYQAQVDKLQREKLCFKEDLEARDEDILQLDMELSRAREELAKMNKPHRELKLEMSSLNDIIEQYKRSVKSLDDELELQKLNQKEHDKKIHVEKQKGLEMERELNAVKSKYITLLSTKFRVDVPNPTLGQEEPGDDLQQHTRELKALLEQEGGASLCKGSFEDEHGDIHDWHTDLITHHYLCRQLYLHYNQQEIASHAHDWEEFISQVKRTRKPYLDLVGGERSKKELRCLLRKGIPIQFRMIVWTSLVFQQVGRLKETKDAATEGESYYWSLVHSQEKSEHDKQIKIDLHRTLPNNRHFKLNGSGIPKLENILIAFSKHNKKIGYCQGMNMVAALGLLFLDEETVFWYMVCITEKLLPDFYFTPDLLGAQSDQLLMKDLLAEKLPRLHSHMEHCGIDVTFVTLNWFLTLFVDSMPTVSALRIMDCFLLEGSKFIFRSSLGILRLNQGLILQKQDSFVLFQFVKELAKHIFDMEAVFQEFPKLAPFPNRATLSSRHQQHLAKVRVQWQSREKERAEKELQRAQRNNKQALLMSSTFLGSKEAPPPQVAQQRLVWDCGCVSALGEVWLCGVEGKLGVVSTHEDCKLSIPACRIISRVICAHSLTSLDLVLVGTLDFNLAAIDCTTKVEKWRYQLSDSVLAIAGSRWKVFAALANGLVAMFLDVTAVDVPEPRMLRVGATTVNSLLLCDPEQSYLWCGCGKAITIMCTESLKPVESVVLNDRVSKLVGSEVGVWVSFRSSSQLALYDTRHYVPLLSVDYCTVLPPQLLSNEEVQKCNHRITSLMMACDRMWVGTGGGRVLIFTYAPNVPDTQEAIHSLARGRAAESETTPTSEAGGGGGLLTDVVESAAKEGPFTPEEEKWVDIEGPTPRSPAHTVPGPTPSPRQYKHRRRTQFGKTLRKKIYHKSHKRKDVPDIYRLELLHCSDVITATNDPVRVLVPCRSGDGVNYAVSCLNTAKTDWKEGVQLWSCPGDTTTQWTFRSLTPNIEVSTPSPPPTLSQPQPGGPDEDATIGTPP